MIQLGVVGLNGISKNIRKIINNISDMELAAIIVADFNKTIEKYDNVPVFSFAVPKEKQIDVLICPNFSQKTIQQASFLASRFNTVYSFSDKKPISNYFYQINKSAKSKKNTSIICGDCYSIIFSIIGAINSVQGLNKKELIDLKTHNNLDFIANALITCARATFKLAQEKKTGAFTMLDVPLSYFSCLSQEEILKNFI